MVWETVIPAAASALGPALGGGAPAAPTYAESGATVNVAAPVFPAWQGNGAPANPVFSVGVGGNSIESQIVAGVIVAVLGALAVALLRRK